MLEKHGSSRSTRSSRLARLARQSRTCRVESNRAKWNLSHTKLLQLLSCHGTWGFGTCRVRLISASSNGSIDVCVWISGRPFGVECQESLDWSMEQPVLLCFRAGFNDVISRMGAPAYPLALATESLTGSKMLSFVRLCRICHMLDETF